jgi:hypothetical protein
MTLPTGPGGGTGGGGTGGGGGDGGDILGPGGLVASRRNRMRRTSTQEAVDTANVPNSGVASQAAPATTTESNRRKRRQRDTTLNGSTGAAEEPNTYTPSLGGV